MGKRLLALVVFSLTGAWSQESNNLVYQVFVRSFADSPTDVRPQGEIGDLRGIIENFDYLNDGRPGTGNDLEAGILWLMPIYPSHSYHGYDIDDYRAVNPDYGTMQDLHDLLAKARGRGVRVILDIALNHTSNSHPWFVDAVENTNSPFRDFYMLKPDDGGALAKGWHRTGNVQYFGLFGSNMPDLNLAHPAARAQMKAVAKFWLDHGVDGFRLDAAKHVFDDGEGALSEDEIAKNNDWWREFADHVYSLKPNVLLVGEVLGDVDLLRQHAVGLDALLDEPFLDAAREHIASPKSGFLEAWRRSLKAYREANAQSGRKQLFQPWVFLGSHDRSPRLASFLEQRTPEELEARFRLGMFLLFSIARFPVLYNGDELMQRGVKWPDDGSRIYDMTLREPFPWRRSGSRLPPQTNWFPPRYDKPGDGVSVQEQRARGKMLDVIRTLSHLRARHPEFANGEINTVLSDSEDWLVFSKGPYLALIRTAAREADYRFHDGWYPEWSNARIVFRSDRGPKRWAKGNLSVPGFGFVLLQRTVSPDTRSRLDPPRSGVGLSHRHGTMRSLRQQLRTELRSHNGGTAAYLR